MLTTQQTTVDSPFVNVPPLESNEQVKLSPREWFSTTHWSTVLAAADHGSPQSAEALEKLCRIYWYPLYAHVRQRGHDATEAEDLTQEFLIPFPGKGLPDAPPAWPRSISQLPPHGAQPLPGR